MTGSDPGREERPQQFLVRGGARPDERGWRPGAMRPAERERIVRFGLTIVLGDRAGEVRVDRSDDEAVWVTAGAHGFGFPADEALGDDPRTVMEHDLEWLVDELCETRVGWAKRLPECPLHPDSHPLDLLVEDHLVTASCPVAGERIRSAAY